jgi:hypothetical protein
MWHKGKRLFKLIKRLIKFLKKDHTSDFGFEMLDVGTFPKSDISNPKSKDPSV